MLDWRCVGVTLTPTALHNNGFECRSDALNIQNVFGTVNCGCIASVSIPVLVVQVSDTLDRRHARLLGEQGQRTLEACQVLPFKKVF